MKHAYPVDTHAYNSYAIFGVEDMTPKVSATDNLVDRFAAALKEKLRAAELRYGYSDDWLNGGGKDDLTKKLLHHVQKGDPRDVAAYCAFAWHHGWSLAKPAQQANVADVNLQVAIRELGLRAFAQRDPKVREGIDLAIDHLREMMR